jgi:PAS domain S-box-containing protein
MQIRARPFSQVPLSLVLVVPFVLLTVATVGLTWQWSKHHGEQAINDLVNQLMDRTSQQVSQHLNDYLSVPHQLNQVTANTVKLGLLNVQDLDRAGQYLWQQVQVFNVSYTGFALLTGEFIGAGPWIAGQGVIIDELSPRTQGKTYAYATDRQGQRTRVVRLYDYNPKNEDWYPATLKAGKPVWSSAYVWEYPTDRIAIAAGQPLYDRQNRLIGIASVDLLLSKISDFLRTLKISPSGKVFIVERNGLLIAASSPYPPFKQVGGQAQRLAATDSPDSLIRATAQYLKTQTDFSTQHPHRSLRLSFEHQRQQHLVQVHPWYDANGLDWMVVIVIPESDFTAQIDANTRTTFFFCLGAFGIVMLVGYGMARWVTQPLLRLSLASQAIADGDLAQRVQPSKIAELDRLAHSFNRMGDQLQRSHQELEEYARSLEVRVNDRTLELQQEVDKRQTTEVALRESEEKFAKAFHANPSAMSLVDLTQGLYLEVNDVFLQHSGYTRAEVIGRSPLEIGLWVNLDERDRFYEILQAEGRVRNFETLFRHQSGRIIPVMFSAEVIHLHGHPYILSSGDDITERKQAEIALEQAKQAAETANRVKSQFLANMSHELRTPLNAILGFTQLMARDSGLSPTQQSNVQIIANSGQHLLSLINDILDLSKIEAGRLSLNETSFDLFELLKSVEEMFRINATHKALQLRVERSPQVPQSIIADEGKLRQVLINLLGNAIKFTQVGSVTLKVETRQEAEGRRQKAGDQRRQKAEGRGQKGEINQETGDKMVSADFYTQPHPFLPSVSLPSSDPSVASRCLLFSVADTGPGIAPHELDHLFEAFTQTELGQKSQVGTGLGLAISRQFVQLMRGEITVSSTVGQGSIFQVQIPIKVSDSLVWYPPKPMQRVVGLAPQQPTYRILIVEDRPENRQFLTQLLEQVGFSVQVAENGQVALESWERWQPHLIWMDMRMPVMDGYEATRRIKAQPQGQSTVIVALTASAFEEEKAAVLAAGCDDFIRKPFREEQIFEKLAEHLGVCYQYEAIATAEDWQTDPASPLSTGTLKQYLTQMTYPWITQLHQAATLADAELVQELVQDLPEPMSPLAATLTDWVNNFRWDEILQLTQRMISTDE